MDDAAMDAVFRALADPTRRALLDHLRAQDGQTQGQVESAFAPGMTRFGVIKHLRVLEACGLVTSVKTGRVRRLYLNTVPVQEIADRWISAYAKPWALGLTTLKRQLEDGIMHTAEHAPKQVYVTIIRTTPEKLWQALTDGAMTPAYYYGGKLETTLAVGSPFKYWAPEGMGPPGTVMCDGTVLECDPPRRLVTAFTAVWNPELAGDPPSRITFEILPVGETCRLTVIHDGFTAETPTYRLVAGGWPGILSGLKTLLETGEPLGYDPDKDTAAL